MDNKVPDTVHVGFILGLFDDSELLDCVDKDEILFDKWTVLKRHMKNEGYSSEAFTVKVSQGVHDLFQEILDDAQERYGLLLPRHPNELK